MAQVRLVEPFRDGGCLSPDACPPLAVDIVGEDVPSGDWSGWVRGRLERLPSFFFFCRCCRSERLYAVKMARIGARSCILRDMAP